MAAARTFVVGDLHGCAAELARLLDRLDPVPADTLVFLGDYIDRGPDSKGVIERLIRLASEGPQCVFLKGNHEDMFLAYLGQSGMYGNAFLFNGGAATLRSYGLEDTPPEALADALPPAHIDFLSALRLTYACGEFLCVHAGVAPTRPIEAQRPEDLIWIRDTFILHPHPFPYTVLFGHTPQPEVLFDLPYKIGLDTGLVYWNKLSCVELAEKRLFQIRRGERRVSQRSVAARFRHLSRRSDDRGATRAGVHVTGKVS